MNRRMFLRAGAGLVASLTTLGRFLVSLVGAQSLGNVVINSPTTWSSNTTVDSLTITPTGVLTLNPAANVLIQSTGNVIVEGRLVSHPNSGVVHELKFNGINEAAFVGGGMDPITSDVGLWVMGAGQLDLVGTPKLGWLRETRALPVGTVPTLDPSWQSGDKLIVTATNWPIQTFADYYGDEINYGQGVLTNHPMVMTYGPEVANLTRNVKIGGTPTGRTHIFIRSTAPQTISNVEIHDVGPRRDANTQILGRYGLHFHHCHDGSRGSIVESCVIHQCGGQGFVPHLSHGITFHYCVVHDIQGVAYWWDQEDFTDATVWERCGANKVYWPDPNKNGRLAAFMFGASTVANSNIQRGCWASGIFGGSECSGFFWSSGQEVWDWNSGVTHNSRVFGSFVWQNLPKPHVVTQLVAYNCRGAGFGHGAYTNHYQYVDCAAMQCPKAIILQAVEKDPIPPGSTNPRLSFTRFYANLMGQGDYAVTNGSQNFPSAAPTLFIDSAFHGYNKAAIGIPSQGSLGMLIDTTGCAFGANQLWLGDVISPNTVVTIEGTRAHRKDLSGTLVPAWNARTF